MSNLDFQAMALTFKIRDFFRPRKHIVKEVGMKEGFHVLDYGCGPGSYVTPVAELVGKSGKVYALMPIRLPLRRSRRSLPRIS
jgi:ubiquinone/menaquinone biosynthesis C-methylase UbiE